MNGLVRLLLNALAVIVAAELLPGVEVDGYGYAIIVAIVIALLNVLVKPLLIILTIPATILTLGLFLFVINACIVLLADWILGSFRVEGFFWALIFSLVLTVVKSLLNALTRETEDSRIRE